MLFNSYLFILIFLPISLIGFYSFTYFSRQQIAIYWLILVSLVFYAFWNPTYLLLILISIIANFSIGNIIINPRHNKNKKLFLLLGILFNLSLIAYYKYANFIINNINSIYDFDINVSSIVLPLAISFFTFQQIAYLVDIYYKPAYNTSFSNYMLFIVFFPQLIAGPIVAHHAIIPQFQRNDFFLFSQKNIHWFVSFFIRFI